MKLPAKPISSPGRADKFPPPLMRFLRSNVGSRSRGRSRSSPMFVLRKKNAAAVETQEPSSPKVTCIGQVRVRRSKQPAKTTRVSNRRRCRWRCCVSNTLFCSCFAGKIKPRSFRPVLRKCVRFFKVGCFGKVEMSEDSLRSEPFGDARDEEEHEAGDGKKLYFEEVKKEDDDKRLARVSISSPCSPPKNALLLTRCRSAPYRSSSSVAGRFWGSQETGVENRAPNIENTDSTSKSEPTVKDSAAGTRNDPKQEEEEEEEEEPMKELRFFNEFEGTIELGSPKSTGIEEWETVADGPVVRPLILTRCNSAPCRSFGKVGAW